ncbi:hypothetical protein HUJ04_000233 [Dendroctonus ponderosae]|nr:hypothetical protein HUJ04_000233 [Dendroctonus ponderosae]
MEFRSVVTTWHFYFILHRINLEPALLQPVRPPCPTSALFVCCTAPANARLSPPQSAVHSRKFASLFCHKRGSGATAVKVRAYRADNGPIIPKNPQYPCVIVRFTSGQSKKIAASFRALPLLQMKHRKLFATALLSTLSCVSDGMQYGWTAPAIPKLTAPGAPMQLTLGQAEWLETILMLGGCCGLPLNLILVDKIGRKGTLVCSSLTTLLAWALMAVAPSAPYLYAARFFAGMAGDTGFVAAPMYIAEVADHKIRGFLSSIIYLMMLMGVVLVYCVTPFVPLWVPCLIA